MKKRACGLQFTKSCLAKSLQEWTELELEGPGADFVSDDKGQMYFLVCFYQDGQRGADEQTWSLLKAALTIPYIVSEP